VNDALLQLFLQRQDIPYRAFPDLSPALGDYRFPAQLLPADEQSYWAKHDLIKRSLEQTANADTAIRYIVPWMEADKSPAGQLDLIFSQAAMEHVADIDQAYRLMHRMLRKGGIISHQVDFRAHEMTDNWDGHFYIGQHTWQLLAHGRKYPMNRMPLSAHLKALSAAGFRLAFLDKQTGASTQPAREPAVPGIPFDADDRVTMGALIQAVKI
jgi:SAM-dependent methyltransferase